MGQNVSSEKAPPYHIFLSHAGEDKQTIAKPLYRRLREHGISVFLDEESFRLGDHCPEVMLHAMETAPVGVFIMSPEFVAKRWPMRELLAFVRRYDRAIAARKPPPLLISIFYRFSTRECRDETIFRTYSELFDKHGLFKRAQDDVTPLRDFMHALDTAATLWSIENDLNATNDNTPAMVSRRESFTQNIAKRISEQLRIESPQLGENFIPKVGNKHAQQMVYTPCNMVPPNPPRLTLDYASRSTCEGRLRAAVLGKSGSRIVAVVATGKGGVGKTCALRGLAEDNEIKQGFQGGILYIELGNDAAISNIVQGIAEIVDCTGGSKLANVIRTAKSVKEASQKASQWFGLHSCLFLVDDIWQVNGIDSDILVTLGLMVNANSRMVYTTRDRNFLGQAEETIEFKEKETLGDLSRQMLMTQAGFELRTVLDDKNKEAFEYFLTLRQGLPLGFGLVGSSVQRYALDCLRQQDAWSEFYNDVLSQRKDLMGSAAGAYGELPKIVDLSLQVLQKRSAHGKFGYWFRALSVIQKQQSVPVQMLQKLWDLATLQEAKTVVESFADVSVVQMTRNAGSMSVRLHDLILDIAVRKATEEGETEKFFRTLVRSYMRSVKRNKRDEATPSSGLYHSWWNVEDDGYMHSNLCRILRSAGYLDHLLWLLSQPQWIVQRWVKGGVLGVEQDLDHGKAMCNDDAARHKDQKAHLEMIRRAARLSAFFVSNNPRTEEAWFQLHGRLLWHATQSKLTSDFVRKMESCAPKPWLKASGALLRQAGGSLLQVVDVPGSVLCTSVESDAIWILSEDDDNDVMQVGRYERSNENYKHKKLECSEALMENPACAAFLPDKRRVVTAHGEELSDWWIQVVTRVWNRQRGVVVWDRHTGACEKIVAHVCPKHREFVSFFADGTRLACQMHDHSIQVWDTLSGKPVGRPLRGHSDWVQCVAMSPDGTRIVTGSHDDTVRLWDAQSGDALGQPLRGHASMVRCVAWSADGTRIVSGSWDHTLRLWDAQTGDAVGQPLRGHTETVQCVAVSADGTRIVSGSRDHTVRMWDAQTGNAVMRPLRGHTNLVDCVAVSADGTRIVSGSSDKTVRLWDPLTGNAVRQPYRGHTHPVQWVAVSADGTRIVFGSWDDTVCLWDAQTGDAVGQPLRGHTGPVERLAVSAGGPHVVSGDEQMQRLWALNANGGECVLTSRNAAWQRTIDKIELSWCPIAPS